MRYSNCEVILIVDWFLYDKISIYKRIKHGSQNSKENCSRRRGVLISINGIVNAALGVRIGALLYDAYLGG